MDVIRNGVTSRRYGSLVAAGISLGERIHDLRVEADMTLAELSKQSGVSISYIADIEKDRTVPTLGRLQDLAIALGTDARGVLRGVRPFGLL